MRGNSLKINVSDHNAKAEDLHVCKPDLYMARKKARIARTKH